MYLVRILLYLALISLKTTLVAGETWTRRRRIHLESDEEDEVLLAARSFQRTGQNKTVGCMADGLRCNIWARAEFPAKLSYELVHGHSGKPVGGRNGRSALQMDVLKWRPGRGVPKPQARDVHPITDQLGPKIVHFLMDYHSDWFASLQLPPSTGKHDQLTSAQIDLVLDRFETIPQVFGEVQLFTAVKISHAQYKGSQIIHCTPFKTGHQKQRMVSIGLYCCVLYV